MIGFNLDAKISTAKIEYPLNLVPSKTGAKIGAAKNGAAKINVSRNLMSLRYVELVPEPGFSKNFYFLRSFEFFSEFFWIFCPKNKIRDQKNGHKIQNWHRTN